MKRLTAVVVAFFIAAALVVAPSFAAGEVFVAAGNTVLPLTDAMPVNSGGAWYIDYQCFTKGNLRVSSSYNATEGTLVLYTWDTTLVFDIKSSIAYTTSDGTKYKQWAFVSSGTVYVPAQFTAQTLGLEYYYFAELPLIRIKNSSSIPNNMFIYIAQESIPDLLAAYNMNKNQAAANPSTGNANQGSDSNETAKRSIRLTFNIENGKNLDKILNALQKYNYKATFFVRGSAIKDNANALRRAVVQGHNLGTLSENGISDFLSTAQNMISSLKLANDKLFEATKTKTRLVRVSSGSLNVLNQEKRDALALNGYRLWDYNVNPLPTSGSYSASRIYNNTINSLKKRSSTATLMLDDSDSACTALTRILSYLSSESYSVRQISTTDTPVNQVGEKR